MAEVAMKGEWANAADTTPRTKAPFCVRVWREVAQAPELRREIIAKLEEHFECKRVLSYFTSFWFPVTMSDDDADVIESMLRPLDLSSGLVLVINSPGGDLLAAERIVNVCRAYAGGAYEAVVPKMAKSAAALVCLGAEKIWMSKTSELGPIDPQVTYVTPDGTESRTSANDMVEKYNELLKQAVETQGHIEPLLMQLGNYDPRDMREYEKAITLTSELVVSVLSGGMMKGLREDEIRRKIQPFIDPKIMISHGRRLDLEAARECDLVVEEIPLDGELWGILCELYARSDHVLSSTAAKLAETSEFDMGVPFTARRGTAEAR